MDTIYYQLNTVKVKASGGAELLRFVPVETAAPASPAGSAPRGEVLDFDRCRRHLETKAAWEALRTAALETPPAEAGESAEPARTVAPRPRRSHGLADYLELLATGAVALVSLAAACAFAGLI